ncbi:MAG: S1 family peptidase [Bdellovibrionales bacterium]
MELKNQWIIFAVLSLAACARASSPAEQNSWPSAGILGGSPVEDGTPLAHHLVAILGNDGTRGYLCTGVLITKNRVLTAAHCGNEMRQGIILFSTDLSTTDQSLRRPVTGVKVQPHFGETLDRIEARPGRPVNSLKNWGDLAVMSFSGGLPRGFTPALIAASDAVNDGDPVILAGFGLLDGREKTQAQHLNAVTVPVKKAQYSKSEFTVDQSGGKGACHGDSGGPAMIASNGKFYLVGITSRGFDDNCVKATIYTRVSFFIDWIQEAIAEN